MCLHVHLTSARNAARASLPPLIPIPRAGRRPIAIGLVPTRSHSAPLPLHTRSLTDRPTPPRALSALPSTLPSLHRPATRVTLHRNQHCPPSPVPCCASLLRSASTHAPPLHPLVHRVQQSSVCTAPSARTQAAPWSRLIQVNRNQQRDRQPLPGLSRAEPLTTVHPCIATAAARAPAPTHSLTHAALDSNTPPPSDRTHARRQASKQARRRRLTSPCLGLPRAGTLPPHSITHKHDPTRDPAARSRFLCPA